MALSPEREQQIRARFEQTTHPDWRDVTDVGVLLAELDRLRERNRALKESLGNTIDDRDRAETAASRLASAIAPEDVLGRHTDGNNPWQNALDWAAERERTFEEQQAEVERLRAQVGAKPSRFHSRPVEIDAFLREHFAEDVLLRYQWAVGDRAVEEAAREQRSDTNLRQLEGEERLATYGRELADLIDPLKGGGHYPSKLVTFAAVPAGGEPQS